MKNPTILSVRLRRGLTQVNRYDEFEPRECTIDRSACRMRPSTIKRVLSDEETQEFCLAQKTQTTKKEFFETFRM